MKIQENKTIYRCSHCNKLYLSKSWCAEHELKCRKNPDNKIPCFQLCTHLDKRRIIITREIQVLGENYGVAYDHIDEEKELLFCDKKACFIYPYWMSNPILQENIKDEIPNEPMPLVECSFYKFHIA